MIGGLSDCPSGRIAGLSEIDFEHSSHELSNLGIRREHRQWRPEQLQQHERYSRIEDLNAAIPTTLVDREPVPYEAAFLAGTAFSIYRKRGGKKRSTLPDFFVGAHASVAGYSLLARDATRYRTYFPKLALIAPNDYALPQQVITYSHRHQ
jgi:predicted nucleic acid-binding protein